MRIDKRVAGFAGTTLVVYLVVVILSGLGWNPFGLSWNFSNPGAFGDAFGPLNSFMAAIAAVAALLAYRSQSQELRRVEQEAVSEKAAREKRDFEQTFFNLLQLFRETVKEIDVSDKYNQNPVSGRDALKRILEEYIGGSQGNKESDGKLFYGAYSRFRDDLAHYFRLFYHILKFVNQSPISEKKRYTGLLRATLSDAEITLIALNCIHGGGRGKLKPLIEKYSMLHNISNHQYRDWRLGKSFKQPAFGDRNKLSNGDLST
jgi:Putative phage abortive infection protein